jgi:hypothetical protein
MVIEISAAGVTVSVATGLVIVPEVAVTLVEPVASVVANPELLMLATEGVAEFHVALLVRSAVVESLYVPVAVNCWVNPLTIDGFVGTTAIDTNVAGATVNVAGGLVIDPAAAVMFVEPAFAGVARPEPLIVATVVSDEFQVAVLVRSIMVESE